MKYFILLLFSIQAICQEKFSDIYYPHIDKAELAITTEDYKQAIQNYESAFAKVKHPLALDLYNTAVCKVRLNDFDGAKPFLIKLAAKGLPIDVLENETIFKNLGSRWELFKPVYIQIQSSFVSSVPEEIRIIAEKLKDSEIRYAKQLKIAYNKVTQEELEKYEVIRKELKDTVGLDKTQGLIMEIFLNKTRLEGIIDSTRGFSENEVGLSDEKLLSTWLNNRIHNPMDQVIYWDTAVKSVYILTLPVKKDFYHEKYIAEGIETGKWHRETIKSLVKNKMGTENLSIAEFNVEEKCETIEHGYYIRHNSETMEKEITTYSFLENEDLELAKTIYNLKGNTDFKLSSPKTVNRLFFASCQSAEAELKKWQKLNIR